MSLGWVALAGFLAGFIAGFAARYGRLCTMGAAEAWIISRDGRALKAWGLSLAIAAGTIAIAETAGWIDLSTAVYRQPQIDVIALLLGTTSSVSPIEPSRSYIGSDYPGVADVLFLSLRLDGIGTRFSYQMHGIVR